MDEPGISARNSNPDTKALESNTAPDTSITPAKKLPGRPWQKGQSGNLAGRPKVEPRVRKYARRYDRKMCRTLAEIAMDKSVPPSERRRAAMDLISVGSGRPALVQEIAGRNGEQLGPLVALNFNAQSGQPLTPEQAYRAMLEGLIPADPKHPSFERPAIEAQPVSTADNAERPDK
jgi:hypothetical protein